MELSHHSQRLMGCTVSISLAHPEATRILEQSFARLWIFEQTFSANSPHSQLALIQRAAGLEPVEVDSQLFELIAIGKAQSLEPNSHLNIAIGPLVQTWRIGFSDAKLPSQAEIDQALTLVNPHFIELDEKRKTVFLAKQGMKIDLGALAKGYAADLIAEQLRQEGVKNALINLGGNVLTLGHNPSTNQAWKIGIQHPEKTRGVHLALLPAMDQSIVTSGIYERKLNIGGQTYHHILDDKTGYPIQSEVASLTILSKTSLEGEIWTTRLFGHSIDTILDQIERQEGLEALLIDRENQLYASSGLPLTL